MRILHYYWTQYNDKEKPGGGVRVYLENLVNQQKIDNDVTVLNSGVDYDFSGKCYIRKLKNNDGITQYTIVNSPILAPSKCSFNSLNTYLDDSVLVDILDDFLTKNGNYDVIHFHSLEGLSVNVLSLKNKLINTKFILSLHNYFPFCPQVNLWKHDSESCDCFHNGQDCTTCIANLPNSKLVRCSYMLSTYLRRFELSDYSEDITKKVKKFYNNFKKNRMISESIQTKANADIFKKFREYNVIAINKYIDEIICVSNRVRDIAVSMGVIPEKCQVIYIGTKFAENQATEAKYPMVNGVLRILYMGYMRKDKGFYFFVEALEKMPQDLASKIEVVIAAKFDDMEIVRRCKSLENKYKSIILYNGYTHKDIPNITNGVNLGLVPVMWEDNLPQVSMEMKSMGIPILASDRGGAGELTKAKGFSFRAGDVGDFIKHIDDIMSLRITLNDYYRYGVKLNNNIQHNEIINLVYK